jgi:hypothetical protein
MNSKKSPSLALDDLKRAVNCLQKFVSEKKEERADFSIQGDVRAVLPFKVRPMAKLVAGFVAEKISEKRHKDRLTQKENERRELFGAIDVIKIHHRLINRLASGSEEDVNFAHFIHRAIDDYNTFVQETDQPPKHLGERIKHYLDGAGLKTLKLSLPVPARVTMTNSDKTYASALDTFERLPNTPKSEEIDLFRMKAIRKIQEEQLLPIAQTHRVVRTCPIDAVTTTEVRKDGSAKGSIMTLRQTCIPLPGEKLDFTLPYDRGENNEARGVPIGDITYHLTSHQTGFPDPALSAGIGLPELFMPSLPLRPELAPTLEQLLDRRQEVAYSLLPQGALNQKAKHLYSLHKQLYDQDPAYFITKHRSILEKLLPLLDAGAEDVECVRDYFSKKMEVSPSFEELSSSYRLVSTHLESAFEELEGSFFSYDDGDSGVSTDQMKEELKKALSLAIDELQEEEEPFTSLLERRFLDCTSTFILQAYSEKYNFAPPVLSQEERRLQSIVFFEQLYFFQQLEKPQELLTVQDLVTTLHIYFDTVLALAVGKAPTPLAQLAQFLVNEVAAYFDARFLEAGSVKSESSLSVKAR